MAAKTNSSFIRLFADNQEITEEMIDFYEKNPDELDLIINKEYFYVNFLGLFFVIGLLLTLISRILMFLFKEDLGKIMTNVVLDVLSELGIAIFGGAVVAYLIEFLNKPQYQQNLKFRREIKRQISLRQQKN